MTPQHMIPLQVALTHCEPRSTDKILDAAIPAILADGGIVAHYCDACGQLVDARHPIDPSVAASSDEHDARRVLIVDAP